MFSLFNKNKTPKTFSILATDMHCHLLPGVDDGSKDISETILCLKAMASVGFNRVMFTPHFQDKYPNIEDDIQGRFEQLKKQLKEQSGQELPKVDIISGEYRFDPLFERRPGVDKVLTLPGKRLLCEFSLHASNYMPLKVFAEYQKLGYSLILAHPERYPYLGIHSKEIKTMKEMGITFQVNILSLNGFYGEAAMQKGFDYIEKGWVEFLGTDMHNARYAAELIATAKNRKVQKLLEKHKFLNNSL